MTTEVTTEPQSWHVPRLVCVWLVAIALALTVIIWLPEALRYEWLTVSIGVSLLLSFVLQLGTAQREGFITRLAFSVIGSALLIGIAQGVALLLGV